MENINWNSIAADLNAEFSEKLKTEDFVVKHGVIHASDNEVKEEFVSLDAVEAEESEDFDNDENLTDMSAVSGAWQDMFDTIQT